MGERRFPPGWDERRAKALLDELEDRTEDERVVADETAAAECDDQTVVTVRTALLPEVRRLLAEREPA